MEAYNLFPSFSRKKKRNFFQGQELLIGLPFKAISKLFLPLLACKNRHTGRHSIIGGNHPAAQGAAAAAGRLWGCKVSKSLGDNSLDYVGI
jgi:hypothetical protein